MKQDCSIAVLCLILLPIQTVNATVNVNATSTVDEDTLYNSGNYTGALYYINKALSADPSNTRMLIDKGLTEAALGLPQAKVIFQNIVSTVSPYDVNTIIAKGVALNQLGNFTEAIFYFNLILAIDPNNIYALENKATALYNLGDYIQAIHYLDKVLVLFTQCLCFNLER